ncbi:protein argonaute-2-like isoform X2 [Euwallacea similis]|uniref:protein argonaute-2-like isoform X2 n=1 Tax=Euwallacea similis TaxID=1736056 RepID=UPI0034508537
MRKNKGKKRNPVEAGDGQAEAEPSQARGGPIADRQRQGSHPPLQQQTSAAAQQPQRPQQMPQQQQPAGRGPQQRGPPQGRGRRQQGVPIEQHGPQQGGLDREFARGQPQQGASHQQQQPGGGYQGQQRGSFSGQQKGPYPGQQQGPFPGQQKGPFPGQQQGPSPGQQQGPFPSQRYQGVPPRQVFQHLGGPPSQAPPSGPPPPGLGGSPFKTATPDQQPSTQAPQGLASDQQRSPPKHHAKGQQQGFQQQRNPPASSKVSGSGTLAKLAIKDSDKGDANLVSTIRKKPGTKGRVIKVESNHLQLALGNLKVAYHYDVTIIPETPKKFMRPVMESYRKNYFPQRYPAFDGKKNWYTTKPLTNNFNDVLKAEISILDENGREKKFQVEIKFANEVDMTPLQNLMRSPATPQEALQVVDIVLRMAPVVSCFPVGRSFFIKPDSIIDLGEGMEMYQGFYQSAIRGWKPLLNVDVAHKAFPQNIKVVDALVQLLSTNPRQPFRKEDLRSLREDQQMALVKFIKTLRVTYEIPGVVGSRKSYRVNGVGPSPAQSTFKHENQEMTIQTYFQRFKNYRVMYPNLPTLWVGNQNRQDRILLPLELCTIIEGQNVNRKMTENQTSKMIRHAATDTATRKKKIIQGIEMANYNHNPCVKEFGFSVGHEFQKLDARVLQPPELQYGTNRPIRVARGVWRSQNFLNPVTIQKWTIASCCRYPTRQDDLLRMASMFESAAREVGMTFISRPVEPFINIGGRQTYSDIEQFFRNQKGYDVIFVVVPDSGPQYSYVKKASEIAVGCLTQCVKSSTVSRKMNGQTAGNILLKVNSKLNGINHTFAGACKPDILKRPVMIMGADVTHPGPDAQNIPSVAAVTASHDPKAFQYNICWRLQNPKMEIIEDLEAITVEHLKFFYSKTKVKPEAIVFFRDGVSEGQFEQVKNAEIRAIRAACKKLQTEGFEPKITFVVVQKRHHTRLFPMNPRDSEDKNCNVPAGTCVDTEITHPFLQDFYLVSHASIQGVAKPTKYCTLWDDNNMDNDQVEQLAYYLCHMFSRCTRSVSYPAPTYYAHLAAARAKVYIENDTLKMDRLQEEFRRYTIKDEIRKDLPMFFV